MVVVVVVEVAMVALTGFVVVDGADRIASVVATATGLLMVRISDTVA